MTFLKNQNSLEDSLSHLQAIAESTKQLNDFLLSLRQVLGLPKDADLGTIFSSIHIASAEAKNKNKYAEEIRGLENQVQALTSDLIAAAAQKNIANHILYEIVGSLEDIISAREQILKDSDYISFFVSTLKKLIKLEEFDTFEITNHTQDIYKLREDLTKKIEDYAKLKYEFADTIKGQEFPSIETLDADIPKFKDYLTKLKLEAAKYHYLLAKGAVREVVRGNLVDLEVKGNILTYEQ